MKTIIAFIACTAAFSYFIYHSILFILDYQAQFKKFLDEYYPNISERHRIGYQILHKNFRGYVFGYYLFSALTFYGAFHLLMEIINRYL